MRETDKKKHANESKNLSLGKLELSEDSSFTSNHENKNSRGYNQQNYAFQNSTPANFSAGPIIKLNPLPDELKSKLAQQMVDNSGLKPTTGNKIKENQESIADQSLSSDRRNSLVKIGTQATENIKKGTKRRNRKFYDRTHSPNTRQAKQNKD